MALTKGTKKELLSLAVSLKLNWQINYLFVFAIKQVLISFCFYFVVENYKLTFLVGSHVII